MTDDRDPSNRKDAPQGVALDPVRVPLEPRLDLGGASTMLETLLGVRGRNLVLDGRNVRHLGASGLQLLVGARRSWAGDGHALSLEAPSDALLEGLERLGASIDAITVEART